ncbi:S41 family peptidase [Candidatus Microgenomates bacterium]|nr:S41 family peptidase [Candidatus Microgenomates bacterium]
MLLKKAKNYLLILLFVIFSFSIGYFLGTKTLSWNAKGPKVEISRSLPVNHGSLDFSLFWKVWDTLGASYFDKNKLVESKMVYGAIQGMVASLGDPYTVFLPPTENKVVEEDLQGNFEGVGIQIGFKSTNLAVIAPLPNSPAEKAGIKAGDLIIGIVDEVKGINRTTSGISLPEAVEAIRGRAGTTVKLTLMREGSNEPFELEVKREKIDVPSVVLTYTGEQNNIANIRVLKFGAETKGEWDKAVTEVLAKPQVKGIVLDLRNNPGGYLQAAVDLASDFVPSSKTVVIEENSKGQKNEYKVNNIGRFLKYPVVVLVNKGSASASEILAGALRDQINAKLVGETSFGKGTIQEPLTLDHGAGLHVTIAKWLTPNGTWVHDKGLEPDFKVEDNEKTDEDEQLQKAVETLQKAI